MSFGRSCGSGLQNASSPNRWRHQCRTCRREDSAPPAIYAPLLISQPCSLPDRAPPKTVWSSDLRSDLRSKFSGWCLLKIPPFVKSYFSARLVAKQRRWSWIQSTRPIAHVKSLDTASVQLLPLMCSCAVRASARTRRQRQGSQWLAPTHQRRTVNDANCFRSANKLCVPAEAGTHMETTQGGSPRKLVRKRG